MMEQMKPSGIDWIKDIPYWWNTNKVKYLATESGTLFLDGDWIESDVIEESGIRYLTTGNVGAGYYKEQGSGYISKKTFEDLHCLKVYPGDLMISRLNEPIGRACIVPKGEEFYVVAVDNVILRPNKEYNKKFIMYAMNTEGYAEHGNMIARGATMSRVSRSQLGQFWIAAPNLSEQNAIADFLDVQCSKLDSIIADLEKQIDTLQKYKKSLITETVTKGLDKSVPMKDSGIEWIGKIPEHWSVKRLKYVMNNFDSQRKPIEAQNRSQEGDVLYDYYGASGVIDKIDEYIFDETALLIGEDGANLVLRNLPLIYIAHGKYWVNNHAHILRPKKDSDLYYMAHQMEIIDYSLFITGSAQPKLSQENLNNVILVVPPLSEQKTMAEYLNEKVSNIDSIIQDKKKQLTIVQGHKKSLIYEYVTGKKRVAEVK